LEHRAEVQAKDVAIIRVEQFHPFPEEQLLQVLSSYRRARELVWTQEESQNMGGWTFMEPRLRQLLDRPIEYVGRDASASPATGSLKIHHREQQELVAAAIAGEAPHIVHSFSHDPPGERSPASYGKTGSGIREASHGH
jgi:2-oxoglutarate dehydrogenase E1 component